MGDDRARVLLHVDQSIAGRYWPGRRLNTRRGVWIVVAVEAGTDPGDWIVYGVPAASNVVPIRGTRGRT